MKIECCQCKEDFEVADPLKPSNAQKVEQKVNCTECGRENKIMWPADLVPFSRRRQD